MPLPHGVIRTLAAFALHRARLRDKVDAVVACCVAIAAGKEPYEDHLRALVIWSQETRAVRAEADAIRELADITADTLKFPAEKNEADAIEESSA